MVKSTLISMATGGGKTHIMGHVARQWPQGRIMLIAHREELIHQGADKLSQITGEAVAIEMADREADEDNLLARPRIVVSSVQTLNSVRRGHYRMEKFDPDEFGLLLTDEAHHATAASYRRIYDYFGRNPELRHLGVTATPDRADEEALGQIFESVAFEYGILDAVNDGWLVPIEQQLVHCQGLDLSACKSTRRDLQERDVAAIMKREEMLHKVVHPTIELAGDSPTLVFAASVEHAHLMAEIFNRHRQNSAVALDGKTDRDARRTELERFANGEFQYLCNCALFLEGFDEPRIGVVAMARPTKSRSLYAQTIGRGTRPLPNLVDDLQTAALRKTAIATSGKSSLLVLDFVGNSGRHKLVSTADILGGNESDQVVERATSNAKRKSAQGERVNMQAELEAARLELEEESRKRRKHIKPKARFNTKSVNPFDVLDILPRREPGWHKGRMATEKQKRAMRRFKVDRATVEAASFWEASQMLDALCQRASQNKCTLKQAKILAKYGESTELSFDEASRKIDAIARNGWKPLETA